VRGETELVGGEPEGFCPPRLNGVESGGGEGLGLSAGGDDDGRVGAAEEDALHFTAIF
jgi:hypothetical protein